jgi:hypothetical protein
MANKGTVFERDMSRHLSRWWSDGERDDIFWKTGGSGNRATQRRKTGKATAGGYGDIMSQSGEGSELLQCVVLELKKGYTTRSLAEVMDLNRTSAVSVWEEWIAKNMLCVEVNGLYAWAIISCKTRRQALWTCPAWLLDDLGISLDDFPDHLIVNHSFRYKSHNYRESVVQIPLEKFLCVVKPSDFIRLSRLV